jgi:DNA-directed RNA polymerase subunit RPC12/RpoP
MKMAIVFHCEHCGKKVSAPDESGGHQGKCPSCNQRIFIPMAKDQVEEIPLRQVDPEEERRRKALKQEEIRVLNKLQEHQEPPPDPTGGKTRPDDSILIPAPPPPANTGDLVRQFMVHMAKGELEAADPLAQKIVGGGPKALKTVEDMAMQEMLDPQLANVPPTVIAGFFKKLMGRFPK